MSTYPQIIERLCEAYNRKAEEREQRGKSTWKLEERLRFLSMLQEEGKTHLLEVGAGTGKDSVFFRDSGLEVICTDLSPEMVRFCRDKNLTAYEMDFLNLDFPDGSFDAVYALNCLLHVPDANMASVLNVIARLLKPTGLFYLGVYGGKNQEGEWPDDHHDPKRFFSFRTDEQLVQITTAIFELVYFKQVPLSSGDNTDEDFHFQSMILRKNKG